MVLTMYGRGPALIYGPRGQTVHQETVKSRWSTVAPVFGLTISTIITSVMVGCATQLNFQRMARVLMVVLISHMFLNLRGGDPSVAREN